MTYVDVSSFALKSNLASLKIKVDKLDIGKLAPVPVDLSTLSDVVTNDVFKKTVYDKLVAKVDNIDTTKFVLKTTFNEYNLDAEKTIKSKADVIRKHGPLATNNELDALENEIHDANSLVKKTDLNAKITEIECKIPSLIGLATKFALTAAKNKIPDVSSLVKKTNYNTKISVVEEKVSDHNPDKYITSLEFNILAERVFNGRLEQAYLVTKTDFDAKLQSLNKKIHSNKTKHLLVETELKN